MMNIDISKDVPGICCISSVDHSIMINTWFSEVVSLL